MPLQMLVMSAGHDLSRRQPQFVARPTRNNVHPIGGMAAHVIMIMMNTIVALDVLEPAPIKVRCILGRALK